MARVLELRAAWTTVQSNPDDTGAGSQLIVIWGKDVARIDGRKYAEERRRTLWCGEVENVAVFPEHVHLLNALNRLHVQLLQSTLQLFVVLRASGLRFTHDFSAHRSLSTYFLPSPIHQKNHTQRPTQPSQKERQRDVFDARFRLCGRDAV